MPYQLKYTAEAKDALPAIPGYYRQQIRRAIEGLAVNPRPVMAEVTRQPNRLKLKFDRWRLIYDVNDEDEIIRILRIRLKRGPETHQGLDDL